MRLEIHNSIVALWCFVIINMVMILPSCCVAHVATTYLYAPGIFVPSWVIGRYTPLYYDTHGVMVVGRFGGDIFGTSTAITGVEFPEIIRHSNPVSLKERLISFAGTSMMHAKFGISLYGVETSYDIDFSRITIGQDPDIEAVQRSFEHHRERYPDAQVVVFGDSRGAAAVFNWISRYNPTIDCCICEAIIDDIPHMLRHFSYFGFASKRLGRLIEASLCRISKEYNRSGPFPIVSIDGIARSLPILLVASRIDAIVSFRSTIRLYIELLRRGYTRVHLLVLPASEHDSYMIGPDKCRYETAVHAFYRKYGILEYDAKKADIGEMFLAGTQPAIADLVDYLRL